MTKQEKKRETGKKRLTRVIALAVAGVMVITMVISAVLSQVW